MASLTIEEDMNRLKMSLHEQLKEHVPGFTRILRMYPGSQILVEVYENGLYKAVMIRGRRR